MKRLLVLLAGAGAISALALVLAWGSLFGGTKAASSAPVTIAMSSIPGAPIPSGVVGSTTFMDVAPGPTTGAQAIATGIPVNSPSPPYPPSWTAVLYYEENNCTPGKEAAIAVYHIGQADQNIFLTDGVQFGALATDPLILIRLDQTAFTDGQASIKSAALLTLRGFPTYDVTQIQFLACGNADQSAVTGFEGRLADDWTLLQPRAEIDMVPDAGGTWCNPVDPVGNVTVDTNYQVAICLSGVPPVAVPPSAGGPPSALQFTMTFSTALNSCIVPSFPITDDGTDVCAELDPNCLDSNPDANAAHTGGTIFNGTGLGNKWTCNISDVKPNCDNGLGTAFIQCNMTSGTGTLTLPVGYAVSWPIAVVSMHSLAGLGGVDNLGLINTEVDDSTLLSEVKCFGETCAAGEVVGAIDNKNTPVPATATFTPAPTNTPVPPTATNTPVPGVRMEKSPAEANLWLMKRCVAPEEGKGCLVLTDKIFGIADVDNPNDSDLTPEGLGAWETQIRFDHKFIALTPVPDNAWLESGGRVANCTMQVLTEDSILQGCVTKDTIQPPATGHLGPEGDGVVMKIYIVPKWQDLIYRSDFRPTKDNGIITDIVDDNCEVTDTQGEQLPGTLPGQLTVVCSDAHITIRMLEGDLDLNCSVDVLDDQAIAFRYGTRLGMGGAVNYDRWFDMEPRYTDDDIDIKDLQFVFGRNWSTCQAPIPDDQAVPNPLPIDP